MFIVFLCLNKKNPEMSSELALKCDVCKGTIPQTASFYFCMTCGDFDICETCMSPAPRVHTVESADDTLDWAKRRDNEAKTNRDLANGKTKHWTMAHKGHKLTQVEPNERRSRVGRKERFAFRGAASIAVKSMFATQV